MGGEFAMMSMTLLAVALVTCPWTTSTTVTYVEYQPAGCDTGFITEAMQPSPIAKDETIAKTENADKDAPITEAVSAKEEDEDIVTENVGFQSSLPRSLSLDHLALDWGVATIGDGTLYPNMQRIGFGSGLFPWGPFANDSSSSGGFVPWACPLSPSGPNPPSPPKPNPVPEPLSLAVWLVGIGVAGVRILARGRKAKMSTVMTA